MTLTRKLVSSVMTGYEVGYMIARTYKLYKIMGVMIKLLENILGLNMVKIVKLIKRMVGLDFMNSIWL